MNHSRRGFFAGLLGIACAPSAAPVQIPGIVCVNVCTLGHWMKASRQILDHAPLLQDEITERLLRGFEADSIN